jgi:1-deoxy-D-xylulose-5-phosphate reductoisomerase
MSDVVENCLQTIAFIKKPSYTDYVETDKETRRYAKTLIHPN